ncbi:MAG: diguanylate cyclase [Candidatus Aegiribacteria sp.]|nr:diguanylate cyclase [Candidatus Aegiribacteria sp.]MBD3295557.1 diguanylate cyclase [Candidatus Fermentibacteria bacterium]
MKPLKIAGYSVLLAFYLILASGRLLDSSSLREDPVSMLVGLGVILLAAALAVTIRRSSGSGNRLALYASCALLVAGVQLTGGDGSVFYSIYLIYLIWVALPSVRGSATEFGLIIGFTQAFSLLNSSIWSGDATLVERLIPLLPPALESLLVPFLSGLVIDWLVESDLHTVFSSSENISGKGPEKPETPSDSSARLNSHLLDQHNRISGADSTCFFGRRKDGYYKLVHGEGNTEDLIQRFVLPPSSRLARMAERSEGSMIIRADSPEEKQQLVPYMISPESLEESLWVILSPVENGDCSRGFIVQNYMGSRPGADNTEELRRIAALLGETCFDRPKGTTEEFGWMTRLAAACNEETLERALNGVAGVLSEVMQGSTVSVAEVREKHRLVRIRVSRGPMANHRRGRRFAADSGIAGWIVKNRVPCRRNRLRRGGRRLSFFAPHGPGEPAAGSCIGVPVMRSGEVFALVAAENEENNAFSGRDEVFLTAAAELLYMREELADLKNRFRCISGTDVLTGLPGITLLDAHLHQMAREVQSHGWYVGVLVADIDDFGRVNRDLGYQEGDKLLRRAASLFSDCFPEDVFIARTGPDSFAACIPKAGRAVMEAMSQKAADALSFQYSCEKGSLRVSASVGSSYTHVNRKVLLLTVEAEKAAREAAEKSQFKCIVREMGNLKDHRAT